MILAATRAIGIDFGTTNSVMALASDTHDARMIDYAAPNGATSVFRSALCFWQDEAFRGGLAHEAGPWAIAEYLDFPQGSRFLQSFKSVAASATFEHEISNLFEKRLRFGEELGQIFLTHLMNYGGNPCRRMRPIASWWSVRCAMWGRPDVALARRRYDAMFSMLGRPVHYVYEPLGAYSFASRLSDPATLLVADFGGGTSDTKLCGSRRPVRRGAASRWPRRG